MFPSAKIVVVDDEEDHVEALVKSLAKLGLACISYCYPDDLADAAPPISGIRVLFLDINLLGGASPGDIARNLSLAISIIGRLIANDNGPYALITWSNTELHESLMDRISASDNLAGRRPFYSRALSKREYAEASDLLAAEVKKVLSDNAPFGALLDWEHRVSRAGESVLRDVHGFSKAFDSGNPSERMDQMLSKLAVDVFGRKHASDHVFEAVNEALLLLLSDALNYEFSSESDNEMWKQAVTKCDEKNELDGAAISRLNTAVFFESSVGTKAYRRGAVLRIPDEWLADEEFELRFGARSNRVRGEFLKLDCPKKLEWVLVQAQAACDFAQGRVSPMPYLLGAIVPENLERKKDSKGEPLELPESVWQSPLLTKSDGVSEVDFHFEIIHGIVYQMTRTFLDRNEFEVLGRLKDQVIGSIAYDYHSHGSRPGYVSFRAE